MSSVAKILLPGIGGAIFKDKKKAPAAAPAAAAPAAAPESQGIQDVADRKRNARAGLLGRGQDGRGRQGAGGTLGDESDTLGVSSSAAIQDSRRAKREGVRGASRRLLG